MNKSRQSSRLFERGFTIVELVVIVTVIAILAGLIYVSYANIIKNSRQEVVNTDAQTAGAAINKYKADHGNYPANLNGLDIKNTGSTFQYSYNSTNGTYCLTSSVKGASANVRSGSIKPRQGGCDGHGVDGEEPITNYATNPGVENTSIGWYSNISTSYPRIPDNTIKRSGAASMSSMSLSASVTMLTLYGGGGDSGNGFAVPSEASTYTQSVYFRSGVSHYGIICVAWRVAGVWSGPSCSSAFNGTPGQWTRMNHTFSVPAGVEYIRPALYVHSSVSQPAGTYAWVDDYMITKGSKLYEYADGSSPSWIWNGTPNQSTSVGPAIK